MVKPELIVDPKKQLQDALRAAANQVNDLTPALLLIAQYWFKSNNAIFTLKGPGQWPDLSLPYKKFKTNLLGSPYPIMLLHGRIMASITAPPNSESIQQIINKKSLVLGTSVPYADALAHPQKHPERARNPVMFGNEATSPKALQTRVDTWKKIMLNYVAQVSGAKA